MKVFRDLLLFFDMFKANKSRKENNLYCLTIALLLQLECSLYALKMHFQCSFSALSSELKVKKTLLFDSPEFEASNFSLCCHSGTDQLKLHTQLGSNRLILDHPRHFVSPLRRGEFPMKQRNWNNKQTVKKVKRTPTARQVFYFFLLSYPNLVGL